MDVTVVIPSFNGANKLPTILRALENQNYKDFEVLVIIDGSIDDSLAIINNTVWKLNLRYFYQDNKGRAGARNTGVSLAKGNLLIFYDDDVMPNPDSVKLHVEGLRYQKITVGLVEEIEEPNLEFSRFRMKLPGIWLGHLGSKPILLSPPSLFLSAANMGINKETFNTLGGFDNKLRDAEDYDLAVRAYYQDISILYIPLNIVKNGNSFTSVKYIERQREYRSAHEFLYKLRRHSDKEGLYWKHKVDKKVLKSFFYFFFPGFLAQWIDKGVFRFLPFRIRMIIYPRIISALSVYYPNRKI